MDAKTESHSSQDATACVEAFSADGAANRSNNVRGGTVQDKKDMWRIGRHQELNRNFRFLSVLGFTAVLMCTWEVVMMSVYFTLCTLQLLPLTYPDSSSMTGLINGGLSGMIYTYIGGTFGMSCAILAMAEMASMAPTSGGQYHWVSEFAPKSCQKFLSYVTGWVCVLGWHTGIAGCSYTVANMLIGIVSINYPDTYIPQRWHGTLLVIIVAFIAIIFNTFFAQKLPFVEGCILILHVFGFFAVLIPLWVLGPRSSVEEVFHNVEDRGGWGNNGLACLVGLIAPIYALIGPDSAVHMSEEIQDASRVLPLAMVWTLIINSVTGFIMLITFSFCVYDIDEILKSSTGFPFIPVLVHATRSVSGATGMTSIMVILQACAGISNVATTSRQVYAFARDGGLPFAPFFSKVDGRYVVPLNALCVSFVVVCLLSLVNIGSSVAFNAIISLGVVSLLASYIISISCVRLKRWRGEPLPPARWSLGKWSSTIETIAILFLVVAWVFAFFPLTREIDTTTMNWSCAIFGSVVLFALAYYFTYARNVYTGPVMRVRPWAEVPQTTS